ncbi:serine/threonine-protein kinase [Isoptericola croceus]|uniref:serine/threonine-protein kinase n=1 Tax=Isoptericola croceus TaxID=3031406 RepID=UPI0023F6A6AA|nr:serine/threonine-protein kinase [Isoptericola croceus]
MSASSPGGASLPAGVTPLTPTDPRFLGVHRVLGRIGRGGMGLVFLGETRTGTRLAIKVVRPEYAQDTEFRTRFRREAAAAQRVHSRFTAALVDADLDGPAPWIATEYIPGPTLSVVVSDDGPLAERDVRSLIDHLAGALRDIHGAGLVHRDLKPANVLLGPDGPRLIDMGIARAADATSLTVTGMQLGTPMFMAPEQATVDEPTAATDVWALGAVAYFAATGKRPFGDARADIMYYRVVHEEPRLDACPATLRPFVEACLTKDPAGRPTVAEILDAGAGLPGPRRSTGMTPDVPIAPDPEPMDDTPADDTQVPGAVAGLDPASGPDAAPAAAPAAGNRRGWIIGGLAAAGVVLGGTGVALAMNWPLAGGPQVLGGPPPASLSATTRSEIDPCVVGRWEQTSMTDTWNLLGEPVAVTGWNGRVLEIQPDGTETVTYDDADPVTGEMSVGTIVDTWSGTSTYRITTSDGLLRFTATDHSGASVDRDLAGFTETYEPPSAPSSAVAYTCDEATLTQREQSGSYEATFTRTG